MKRIYHTWDKWECYPAGFYEEHPPGKLTAQDCELQYKSLLRDIDKFEKLLSRVITEWKFSCEHYLSNERMNRIAWLGQAALTIGFKIPARFRGGYNLLSDSEKEEADLKAFEYLNKWLKANKYKTLTFEEATSKTEMDLY